MVTELLFLVTSVICVRIRGVGSEVMVTLYHFCSNFHLQLPPYLSGFIVLFPCYLSSKRKTYKYSV